MTDISPLVLIGPSGAGKSTIAAALAKTGAYEIVRSYTTRAQRPGEDSSTHIFVSDDEFDQHEKDGDFIGGTELFGHRYALPRLDGVASRPILIIRAPLVPLCRKLFPSCRVVALSAPVETLIERILMRGDDERTEQDNFTAELTLGASLADHTVDTTEPIDACVVDIIAHTNA